MGIVSILTALVGVFAGSPKRVNCCLSPYLTFSALLFAVQAGMVLYVFIAPGKAVESVTGAWQAGHPGEDPPVDKIQAAVDAGRWVLLSFLCAQILAVFVAVLLGALSSKKGRQWEPFVGDEENQQNTQYSNDRLRATEIKLAKLRAEAGLPPPKMPIHQPPARSPTRAPAPAAAAAAQRSPARREPAHLPTNNSGTNGSIPAV